MPSEDQIEAGQIRYINEANGRYVWAIPEEPGRLKSVKNEIIRIYSSKTVTEQGFSLYYKRLPADWVCIRLTKDATKPVDTPQDTSKDKFVRSVAADKVGQLCLDIADWCEKEGSEQ